MKIAAGVVKDLEYLHDKANPPVIYRDFKSSNILLDEGFVPKLSDFGLAKLGPTGDKSHVSTRVMGTYGYCAPEYAMTGQLTVKSDVYSFGVVFLELITGQVLFSPFFLEHWFYVFNLFLFIKFKLSSYLEGYFVIMNLSIVLEASNMLFHFFIGWKKYENDLFGKIRIDPNEALVKLWWKLFLFENFLLIRKVLR